MLMNGRFPLNTSEAAMAIAEPQVMAPPMTRDRAGVLTALFITGFTTFLTLYVTQPLLPRFRQIFHSSEALVSLTVSAPVLAVALTAPLVGVLADALGRKRVIVAALLGLALPTGLAATAGGLGQLLVWRFLQGLFIPGVIAVVMAYISEESPRHVVGSTMATYVTGTVVGGFAGRFLMGWGSSGWGWHAMFAVLGAITLAGALATWWLLPRSTKHVRRMDDASPLQTLGMHLHNPQLVATYLVGFNVLFCLTGTFTYVNFYLADEPFHLKPAALASIFAVYLIGAVITPMAGRILDRVGYRRALMGAVGMGVTGILMTLIHRTPLVIAGLALSCSGTFVCQSAASSNVGKAAGKARSSAAGLYVALYYLGGCVGSALPGFFWKLTGWPGCVAMIIAIQTITMLIAKQAWRN